MPRTFLVEGEGFTTLYVGADAAEEYALRQAELRRHPVTIWDSDVSLTYWPDGQVVIA